MNNKKKLFLGIAGVGLLGLVGAGVGLLNNVNVVETKAEGELREHAGYTNGDTIYLQLKDAWKADNAKFAFYFFQSTNDSNNKWSPILTERTVDSHYKYVLDSSFTLEYDRVIAVRLDSSATTGNWGNKLNQTGDLEAAITTNCVWLPDTPANSGGGFYTYSESRYTLHVGARSVAMALNPDNDGQVYGTISGASAGDWVGVAYNDQDPGNVTRTDKYSNNLDGDNKLKVGGDVTVYLNRDGWGAWVDGYNNTMSIPLQNFCDDILAGTISAGSCYVGDNWLNDFKLRWDGSRTGDNASDYNLSPADKTRFTNAVPNEGEPYSYTGVLQEARTRYVHLVKNKGAVDFAGIVSLSKVSTSLNNNNDNGIYVVITISSIALLSAGAFIVLSKKKNHSNLQ